jgi:hypothetical protein
VDERLHWEALRAELRSAQTAYDAGDRETALDHVDAALAIDPDFLAAQCLRDQVLSPPEPVAPVLAANLARPAPTVSAFPERLGTGPQVSADGRALFEQRVKRRGVDRLVDAARAALKWGYLENAVAALDEIIELDPDRPELGELTAELDQLRRPAASRTPAAASSTPGPKIAAAAVFVIAVIGPWLPESPSLRSHPMVGSALLVSPLMPTVITTASTSTASTGEPEEPIDDVLEPRLVYPTAGQRLPMVVNEARAAVGTPPGTGLRGRNDPVVATPSMAVAAPASVPVAAPASGAAAAPAFVTATGPGSVALTGPPPHVALTGPPAQLTMLPRPVQPRPAVAAPALSSGIAATSVAMVNDELIIRQTLERYRSAYNGLDARSAQAVYPALNQTALARAFDSLQSQSLAFDACDMQVGGWSATATCHGSTRYVPKIGDHALHTEPRVWSFTLSKNGDLWKIENARTER